MHPSAYLQNFYDLFVHSLFQQKDPAYQGTVTSFIKSNQSRKSIRFKPNKHSS